jgi:quercetin dioxygenase-like cupin family protein
MTSAATSTIQVENERTRVTEWRIAPGASTGFHRHEMDYVVVPQTTGALKVVDKQGKVSFGQMTAGASYFRAAGVEHDIINDNAFEMNFIEVEYK